MSNVPAHSNHTIPGNSSNDRNYVLKGYLQCKLRRIARISPAKEAQTAARDERRWRKSDLRVVKGGLSVAPKHPWITVQRRIQERNEMAGKYWILF